MALGVIMRLADDGRIAVKFDYHEGLLATLKDTVPYSARAWEGAPVRVWWIDADWADVLGEAFKAMGVIVIDKRPPVATAAAVPPPLHAACARLCITPEMPVAIAEAVYKAWARLKHPDIGGTTEAMQQLNADMQTFKAFNEVPF